MKKIETDLSSTTKRIQKLGQQKIDLDQEIEELRKAKKDQADYLKEINERKAELEAEFERVNRGQAGARDNDARLQMITQDIEELTAENAELDDRLDNSKGNVSTFIREMSAVLDAHELHAIMHGMGDAVPD